MTYEEARIEHKDNKYNLLLIDIEEEFYNLNILKKNYYNYSLTGYPQYQYNLLTCLSNYVTLITGY